jgi:hypothetical protein
MECNLFLISFKGYNWACFLIDLNFHYFHTKLAEDFPKSKPDPAIFEQAALSFLQINQIVL